MNRYLLIRRLRGPVMLLLVGINALLAQTHILGWGQSWPLYLIVLGVMMLAERAALATDGGAPWTQGNPNPGAPAPTPPAAASQPPQNDLAIVRSRSTGFDDIEGGQS